MAKASTSSKQLRDMLLCAYGSVLSRHGSVYCSAPITSGRRYVEWLQRINKSYEDVDQVMKRHRASHALEVVTPNREHARGVIERLRRSGNGLVIDPTALPNIPGWGQADWTLLWEEVICRFAGKLAFVEGWEYSNGCAHEFLVAHRLDLATHDEGWQILSLSAGCRLLEEAIREMRNVGAPIARLKRALTGLKTLKDMPRAKHSINLDNGCH